MRRPLVGRRAGVGHIARPDHLRLRACQAIGQFGDLARELENHAVLLLHVALEEGEAFFEIVKLGVHPIEDGGQVGRGKPMRGVCDYYDNLGPLPCFTDCLSTISL